MTWSHLLAVFFLTAAQLPHSDSLASCALGKSEQYTTWLGRDGTLKFPVSQYERDLEENLDLHFTSPDQFMDDFLMLHSCNDSESIRTDGQPTSGCNHCASSKTYSCYGSNLTEVELPSNLKNFQLSMFRMNFVDVHVLKPYTFANISTRHLKIQFGGVQTVEGHAFDGILDLNTLSLTRNEIHDLGRVSDVFTGLDNLTLLILDHNQIRTWDTREYHLHKTSMLPKLEFLSLDGNPFDRLNSSSFNWLRNAPLKYLNLRECHLSVRTDYVLSPIKDTLQYLDLGSSELSPSALKRLLGSLAPDEGCTAQLKGLGLSNLGLHSIPVLDMETVRTSLKYLSLNGNAFEILTNSDKTYQIPRGRATYLPDMPRLIELDLQGCQMKVIKSGAFELVPNLEVLLLGNNALSQFEDQSWRNLDSLRYLDLSFNSQDPFSPPLFGYVYEPTSMNFQLLPSLKVLDLSGSKISYLRKSAFHGIGAKLKNLSLCLAEIESIDLGVFENLTGLEVLDMGGNVQVAGKFNADLFVGLENLLHLHMVDCNLDFQRQIYSGSQFNYTSPQDDPFQHFTKLKILNLTDNNIKFISNTIFQSLRDIEVIELGFNRVLSWTEPVFEKNTKLAYLNLKRNRVSFVTETMLREFSKLEVLDLSENPFLCDCYITPFLQLASNSNYTIDDIHIKSFLSTAIDIDDGSTLYPTAIEEEKRHIASNIMFHDSIIKDVTDFIQETLNTNADLAGALNAEQRSVLQSMLRMDVSDLKNHTLYVANLNVPSAYSCLDSLDSRYIYFISTNETYCSDRDKRSNHWDENVYDPAILISITFLTAMLIGLLLLLVYTQRWQIRYFVLQLKNAAILSFIGRKKDNGDSIFNYDVFVSYSDVNRSWVMDNLLPNLEKSNDLKVCLHERDFQVGISILENIIASMDRSRCILLVVSLSFVKSQWCQFELHLAQHRLLETKREELILVLLEDIPKSKRPKMLHYLMLTKTYIVWPKNEADIEAKKTFWKRLRKAVTPLGVNSVSDA